jgi:hypothetical protein
MEDADRLGGLEPSIEVHRDTCTETPEKTYALADGYLKMTGKLLPLTWDFSHLAVVKHLMPESYVKRLLVRPKLIQRSQQFHFRPFNGHHCQVPVTRGDGSLTRELRLVAVQPRAPPQQLGGGDAFKAFAGSRVG